MYKRIVWSAIAVFAGAIGFSNLVADDLLKAGFVYGGMVRDHGWTFQHDQGRLVVEEKFAGRVETKFVAVETESGDDPEPVLRQLAAQGYDPIFVTSFGFSDAVLRVAEEFPDVHFEIAAGDQRAANVGTYSARFYEGRYVIGRIAGAVTRTNIIGYIASFPVPEVVRGINSFTLGLKSINPDATVKLVWIDDWFDFTKEGDAANLLADLGADVLVQHTNSHAPLVVAEARGLAAFGQASDLREFAPNAHLTAIVNNWGAYYAARIDDVMEGSWVSQDSWDGLAGGTVKLSEFNVHSLSPDVISDAEATLQGIRSGAIHPFTGPIMDRAGNTVIGAGEVLSDEALRSMQFFVEGVETLAQ